MKITGVQAIPLAIPMKPTDPVSTWRAATRKQIVVRVQTDEGLTGTGEAFAYGAPLEPMERARWTPAPSTLGRAVTTRTTLRASGTAPLGATPPPPGLTPLTGDGPASPSIRHPRSGMAAAPARTRRRLSGVATEEG